MSNDLVVVVPGLLGSTLRRHGKLVWAPTSGSLIRAIGTFGQSIKELQPPAGVQDNDPEDGVEAVDVVPDVHALPGIWTPVKGYTALLDELGRLGFHQFASRPSNLLAFAYDWRLSNRLNARRLATKVEPALDQWRSSDARNAEARIVFVCHSMGGLIARWYTEKCGGSAITRKIITLGTPYRGAAKALIQLVNGVHHKFGPLSLDLSELFHSMPSAYELLPEYACIHVGDTLLKVTEMPIPNLSSHLIEFGVAFHSELLQAERERLASRELTHAIVGTRQPTATTARISPTGATALDSYLLEEYGGDSTVPLVGAAHPDVDLDSNVLKRIADKHGNLHRNAAALQEVGDIIVGPRGRFRAADRVPIAVDVVDFLAAGQPLDVQVSLPQGERHTVVVRVRDERHREVAAVIPRRKGNTGLSTISDLPPGVYSVDVCGIGPASPVAPVSADVLVWDARFS